AQDESGATPLIRASTRGHTEAVRLLLARGAAVNLPDRSQSTALHWAANRDHIDIVQALITAGADLGARNAQGMTPMMVAMEKGRNNIALLLQRSGARE
ncbi:MAG: ankyrin repeat domain-containing protein, partial [Gammaproteobacteria bacterium]